MEALAVEARTNPFELLVRNVKRRLPNNVRLDGVQVEEKEGESYIDVHVVFPAANLAFYNEPHGAMTGH